MVGAVTEMMVAVVNVVETILVVCGVQKQKARVLVPNCGIKIRL